MEPNSINPMDVPTQGDASMEARPVQQGDASMEARSAEQMSRPSPAATPQSDQRALQPANPQSNQDPSVPSVTTRQMPHKPSLFDSVLRNLDPSTKVDPVTGRPLPMPSRKSMTAHILAGAITSIIQGAQAGAAAGANAPAGPAGTNGPANLAAMGAGAQAGAQARENIRTLPAQRQEEQQLRQYNTMKRNIDLHSSMLNLGQLQHDNMMKAIQPSIDTYNQAKIYDSGVTDPSKKLILDEGLTGAQAMEKYKGKMSQADFVPMGTKKMYNADGSPSIDEETGVQHEEPIFAVINPGSTLPATDDVKEQLKYMNPNADKIPANAQVRLSSIMAANMFHTNQTILQSAGESWGKQIATITGDKTLENVDLGKLARENKTIRDGMKYINNYNHLPVDEMLAALGKDKEAQKAAPGIEGVLAHALGMDKVNDKGQKISEVVGLARKAQLDAQKTAEEVSKRQQDNVERRELHQQELKDAADIKTKGLEQATNTSQPFPNNWKSPQGVNYDMSHPAMKLVDGSLAPPQLSKRATKGSDSYNNIIKQADDYSMAKYGKPFDFENAERSWKYANQKSTQDTLKLVTSLTGEGGENSAGTLAQLQRQYAALGNTPFSTLNEAKQWVETHIGEPGVPAFRATLFGVSDEMAKILGGGTATVEGFRQASSLLDNVLGNRASAAAIDSVRGTMANRANSMVGDNLYLMKDFGKMRNPLEPKDVPTINGVVPIKSRVINGNTVYMLPTGVVVDRRGRTVNVPQ
jgi:hypothetical protein